MPDGDKNFGGSLVFDFRKWRRHMETIFSSSGTRRIVCVRNSQNSRNSQMASSLSQIRVLCNTLTMLSFPPETEKNVQAMRIYRFLQ